MKNPLRIAFLLSSGMLIAITATAQTSLLSNFALHSPPSSYPDAPVKTGKALLAAPAAGNNNAIPEKNSLNLLPKSNQLYRANKATTQADTTSVEMKSMTDELTAWVANKLATQENTPRRKRR